MKNSIPSFSLTWMTERQKTVQKLYEHQKAGMDITIIDVRQSHELADTGIIEGSILIPQEDISEDTLYDAGIRENDEIVIVCWSGKRSAVVCEVLQQTCFQNVCNLCGGIEQWKKEGLPLFQL